MFKISDQTLCSGSGPSFPHCTSLHISGKWDGSLLRRGENLMQVNSYESSLAAPYCILLTIKYKADTIYVVQQKCPTHRICCMFVSGIFHRDNSSLLFNTIHVWLQKQSIDFKVKTPIAFELLCPAHYKRYCMWHASYCARLWKSPFCMKFFRLF